MLQSLNSPAEHHTIDLNIRKFKKFLNEEKPFLTRSNYRKQIKKYKQSAWADYTELVKHIGSFPTHPAEA